MTLFFFLVALELKREIVLRELGQPRVAALSIAAATGGMLVPAAIYVMLQSGQPEAAGWGTVMGHRYRVRDRMPCPPGLAHSVQPPRPHALSGHHG